MHRLDPLDDPHGLRDGIPGLPRHSRRRCRLHGLSVAVRPRLYHLLLQSLRQGLARQAALQGVRRVPARPGRQRAHHQDHGRHALCGVRHPVGLPGRLPRDLGARGPGRHRRVRHRVRGRLHLGERPVVLAGTGHLPHPQPALRAHSVLPDQEHSVRFRRVQPHLPGRHVPLPGHGAGGSRLGHGPGRSHRLLLRPGLCRLSAELQRADHHLRAQDVPHLHRRGHQQDGPEFHRLHPRQALVRGVRFHRRGTIDLPILRAIPVYLHAPRLGGVPGRQGREPEGGGQVQGRQGTAAERRQEEREASQQPENLLRPRKERRKEGRNQRRKERRVSLSQPAHSETSVTNDVSIHHFYKPWAKTAAFDPQPVPSPITYLTK
mmetsp:Transcript_19758/g.44441  ORF Transcript_19758/g.44441 Transcript_19758/m.44441 type:complete len:377 (-) Transcript_19758:18-1148(-)